MKCGKPYCACVGECFAQQSPLSDKSGGYMTTEAEQLVEALENDGIDCTCAAYSASECCCDANWAEYHAKDAAALIRQQAAEIERLQLAVALKNGQITKLQDEANDARLEIERLREALASARVQAIEEAAKVCEEYETENDVAATWLQIVAKQIRALIGSQDAEAEAAEEQSLDYFNRYVAGDR